MKKAILVGAMAFVGLGTVTTGALADPTDPAKKSQDYEYKFTDDKLLGDTMGAAGAKIVVRKPVARERLLRPRLQFVQEMLKSVENM